MPKIDLTFTEGAIADESLGELGVALSRALLKWEGAPENDFFRAMSWTHVHRLAADSVADASQAQPAPHFLVEVTVPDGSFSERRSEGLTEEVTGLIAAAAGLDEQARMRVWVIVKEVREGSWGAGGRVIRFEELRGALAAERAASA